MLHDYALERGTVAKQIYSQATISRMIDKCTRSGESIDKATGRAAPAWRRMAMKRFVRGVFTTAFVMTLARPANPWSVSWRTDDALADG